MNNQIKKPKLDNGHDDDNNDKNNNDNVDDVNASTTTTIINTTNDDNDNVNENDVIDLHQLLQFTCDVARRA
jgi:hypothetical protein